MLHIQDRKNLRVGQVLCLHMQGGDEPDLSSDENPFIRVMIGMNSASVVGVGIHFYACNRNGEIFNGSETEGAILPKRLDNLKPGVSFIPVIQLRWSDVQGGSPDEEKCVVYNPAGELLQRLIARNVKFLMPDGSHTIADDYQPLYYKPTISVGRFTIEGSPVQGNPEDILKAFADKSGCDVGDLVFVPSD